VALAILAVTACSDQKRYPNILLITLDTTRADRLGCYGYDRDTSPALDALAAESVLYTRAVSTSSWTLPAHATLFTGKFPTTHGALYDPEGPLILTSAIDGPQSWDFYRARGLAPGETTLAGLLREQDYSTVAVVGGPWLKTEFGLNAGFDYYDDLDIDTAAGRRAQDVTDRAVKWIERNPGKRFFLFLNYYDPHGPYDPPEPFFERFVGIDRQQMREKRDLELLSAAYDGEIAYMDHHIGRLFDRLRELELWDETWIIVTSDHGELFGENDRIGHGHYLTEPELRAPLIVKDPGPEPDVGRVDLWVQLTDILPLITERLGLPLPQGVQGSTLHDVSHPILAEVYPLPHISRAGDWRAIYQGSYKYAWNSRGGHELFDLESDPGEQRNLVNELPEKAAELHDALERHFAQLPPAPPIDAEDTLIDEETMKSLRNLGYVD
jgi:arylsulfatase A-like enzyme